MGTFRLFLALAVLYLHAGAPNGGYNVGVIAVVGFFVISGKYMAQLAPSFAYKAKVFYVDRVARIYPQYLLFWGITVATAAALGTASLSAKTLVLSAALVPLGYYMYLGTDLLVIPPTWTLGLEITFYLFFPLLWRAPRWVNMSLAVASFLVFTAASLDVIQNDYFGYRLLPGTLAFFLAGAALTDPGRFGRSTPWFICCGCLLLLAYQSLHPGLYYDKEVMWGALLGIPVVWVLSRVKSNGFDRFLGGASYGVYLVHWPLLQTLHLGLIPAAVLSIAIGGTTYLLIDAPLQGWRAKRRASSKLAHDLLDLEEAVHHTTISLSAASTVEGESAGVGPGAKLENG